MGLNIFSDKFTHECGVMGVWNVEEASNLVYLGLYAQQHRGQEGAGIVSKEIGSDKFFSYKKVGLVAEVFEGFNFSALPGNSAIGHIRYTTAGGSLARNLQPFTASIWGGEVALCHNGNLINAEALKEELVKRGAIFSSFSDTEVILHLIAKKAGALSSRIESVIESLKEVKGAYSLLILFSDSLLAVRDPWGIRPLCIGRLKNGWVSASESCAFDLIGAEYVRDVKPGEIVIFKEGKTEPESIIFSKPKPCPCIFEFVYFARPDSKVYGREVYKIRQNMGRELAKEAPADADIVVPVPDSGVLSALGFSQESKIPFEMALVRNHYVGRTFIEPAQAIRSFGVKVKLNPVAEIIQGKRIVLVDDSIVRGTTSKKIINMLKHAGAKEIHFRIASPPIISPCFYGIDTPSKEELIAARKGVDEIEKELEVNSLKYLSLKGLYRAVGGDFSKMCDACFTNNYPIRE
ncbi:MAG: amidophosphoribosyltransferase [Candidatus Dadabacteria bacterium]|nr:MAG: amidophosphoribosyltransferase [Candidatus Dadabacteria bacterium]